jgi:hypothetical protein
MKKLLVALTLSVAFFSCKDKSAASENSSEQTTTANPYAEEYIETPEGNKLLEADGDSSIVYNELKQKYATDLVALKKEIESNHAKMILLNLTPEVGNSATASTKKSSPVIAQLATVNQIDYLDLSDIIAKQKPEDVTQIPKDGHWSAKGAALIADIIAAHLQKYADARSDVSFQTRPATFGDMETSMDVVQDGGKDLPYHIVTNKQGLRNNYELAFPKTKQRVLFVGDSQLFSPFLDNEQTTIGILQQRFPEKEFFNAAVIGYTLEDYLSLYKEKGKFTEADIVIVGTNPNDIADYYFSQRNRMARSHKPYAPSAAEKALYSKMFQ